MYPSLYKFYSAGEIAWTYQFEPRSLSMATERGCFTAIGRMSHANGGRH